MTGQRPVIRPDSPEAASLQTITGWVSRDGVFYGSDERIARYAGSTVSLCEGCGEECDKHRIRCDTCQGALDLENFTKRERAPWDGEQMLYSDTRERYFSEPSDVLDFAESEGVTVDSLRIVLCDPEHLHQIEVDEWCDVLPEDYDSYSLPPDVRAALEMLNEAIEKAGPVSWTPGDKAWNGEQP